MSWMKWDRIRRMGQIMGHAVAREMPETLPDDDLEVIRLAIAAYDQEAKKNVAGRMPANLHAQPFSWDGTFLSYGLGSWVMARNVNDGWLLEFRGAYRDMPIDGVLSSVADHYGLNEEAFRDRYEDHLPMATEMDKENSPVLALWMTLGELLPEDHYSGKTYRALMDEWPYDA